MNKLSEVIKVSGKLFRYNYEDHTVEYVSKADEEMLEEEAKWKAEHNGNCLFGFDDEGYMVMDSAGLCLENWNDHEARIEYLSCWADDLDEEFRIMEEQFVKYELPLLGGANSNG